MPHQHNFFFLGFKLLGCTQASTTSTAQCSQEFRILLGPGLSRLGLSKRDSGYCRRKTETVTNIHRLGVRGIDSERHRRSESMNFRVGMFVTVTVRVGAGPGPGLSVRDIGPGHPSHDPHSSRRTRQTWPGAARDTGRLGEGRAAIIDARRPRRPSSECTGGEGARGFEV